MIKSSLLAIGLSLSLSFFVTPALAANDDPPCVKEKGAHETGKISFEKKNIGLILSYKWGEGMVKMNDGRSFKFSMKGFKLADNGASVTQFEGIVYNLKDPADFAGTYSGAKTGAVVFNVGAGQMLIENGNGKCIFVKAQAKSSVGLNLSPPGPTGLTIKLVN